MEFEIQNEKIIVTYYNEFDLPINSIEIDKDFFEVYLKDNDIEDCCDSSYYKKTRIVEEHLETYIQHYKLN
jgi:hypothetical protein